MSQEALVEMLTKWRDSTEWKHELSMHSFFLRKSDLDNLIAALSPAGEVGELFDRLESYGFECEAGPLENCVDYQKLKASLTRPQDERDEHDPPVEQELKHLDGQIHELLGELGELVKALEPFAKAADYFDELFPGEANGQVHMVSVKGAPITLADCRQARDLVEKHKGEGE